MGSVRAFTSDRILFTKINSPGRKFIAKQYGYAFEQTITRQTCLTSHQSQAIVHIYQMNAWGVRQKREGIPPYRRQTCLPNRHARVTEIPETE
jgi:hypothetical protein